ncbi:hypothetical protein BFJ68_g18535 [Fusarium oxysporum]|uniref:Uncharacterized protein n=1 Tax=Fusarium oxysporum TaxID=5507 RepID=A0A420MIC0_FUSOX|nr:hypothetical protein BFJ68_g18535 [Fusarium oxysporum]
MFLLSCLMDLSSKGYLFGYIFTSVYGNCPVDSQWPMKPMLVTIGLCPACIHLRPTLGDTRM